MNLYAAEKTESGSSLSETDRAILDSYAKLLPAFSAVLGGCCLVVLRSAAEKTYPCIAVENGVINQTNIGDPAPNFIIDAIGDDGDGIYISSDINAGFVQTGGTLAAAAFLGADTVHARRGCEGTGRRRRGGSGYSSCPASHCSQTVRRRGPSPSHR